MGWSTEARGGGRLHARERADVGFCTGSKRFTVFGKLHSQHFGVHTLTVLVVLLPEVQLHVRVAAAVDHALRYGQNLDLTGLRIQVLMEQLGRTFGLGRRVDEERTVKASLTSLGAAIVNSQLVLRLHLLPDIGGLLAHFLLADFPLHTIQRLNFLLCSGRDQHHNAELGFTSRIVGGDNGAIQFHER